MIQETLMGMLKDEIDGLSWSVDYYTEQDNTGTVYFESPHTPDVYDTEYRLPTYMVYIRSSDWEKAEKDAYKAFDVLHKQGGFKATENDQTFYVFLIESSSDVLRLGVDDDVMEYTVNFDVTLKGEKDNG